MEIEHKNFSPISYSIKGAASGLSRSGIYRALSAGRLRAVKLGNRTLIPRDDLKTFIGTCAEYSPTIGGAQKKGESCGGK